jgi:hypothetical protein
MKRRARQATFSLRIGELSMRTPTSSLYVRAVELDATKEILVEKLRRSLNPAPAASSRQLALPLPPPRRRPMR